MLIEEDIYEYQN
jgi:hypothetical protein